MKGLKESARQWLSGMKTDGCKYKMCSHAYSDDSLDATSLAYDLEQMLGVTLSPEEAAERKTVLDQYQSGVEGFFYEHGAEERFKNSTIDRVLEMHGNYLTFQAIGAYRAIGLLPARKITFYDRYINNISKYLSENCPWARSPWGAGGMVDNLGTILKCNIDTGHQEYLPVIDELFDWIEKNQDDDTGLWKKRENVQGVNGLVNGGYHLMRGTYFLYGRPFSKPERIIDSILEDISENKIFHFGNAHGCNDLDHFFLLQKCCEMVPGYRKDEIQKVSLNRKRVIMEIVRCTDGGFSFHADKAVEVHNYCSVSPGAKESDMQGTVFYLQTLASIAKILGEPFDVKESRTHG